jgi:glycosyltransferase involved in cell wall biosynthesis
LLDRTLRSLSAATRPANLRLVVVVENGTQAGAETVVRRFADVCPIEYLFSEKANKSASLNLAMQRFVQPEDFILFFDDDVRLSKNTLVCYEQEAASQTKGIFFVGATGVDYQSAPLDWVKEFLPFSAIGWAPSDTKMELKTPDGLGFNWAGYGSDLLRVGGFDPHYGPGSGARGQETNMYERLLAAGVRSMFLPGPLVYHYVPQDRCSPEWVLDRAVEVGRTDGQNQRSSWFRQIVLIGFSFRHVISMILRWLWFVMIRRPEKAFYWHRGFNYYCGYLAGFATRRPSRDNVVREFK